MHDLLTTAMAPVLADLQATGVPLPQVADTEWTDDDAATSAMLWSPQGGSGIWIRLTDGEADRIAHAAEQVQEWAIEELWASSATNWPPCPKHPDTHPLAPAVHDGVATWACPKTGDPFVAIGTLS